MLPRCGMPGGSFGRALNATRPQQQQQASKFLVRTGQRSCRRSGEVAQRRTFLQWIGRRQTARLEAEADLQHFDGHKQAQLMRELNKFDPAAVIKRFESGRFAVNDAGTKEYLTALVKLGRLDRASLPDLARRAGGAAGAEMGVAGQQAGVGGAAALSIAGGVGGAGEPVHVIMAEPSTRSQVRVTVVCPSGNARHHPLKASSCLCVRRSSGGSSNSPGSRCWVPGPHNTDYPPKRRP